MSVEEWELLLRASERTQQPVLRMALGLSTLFSGNRNDTQLGSLKNHIVASCILHILESDATSPSKHDRIAAILGAFRTPQVNNDTVRNYIRISYGQMANTVGLTALLEPLIQENIVIPNYAHAQFAFDDLGAALDLALLYEEAHGNGHIRDYCSQMITRYKWIKDREEFAFLRVAPTSLREEERSIDLFVEHLFGLQRRAQSLHKLPRLRFST